MARNVTWVDAPPEAVWDVLCDPFAYPGWVVGSQRTIEADPQWPQPESAFRVRVGVGPLTHEDLTHSRRVEPGRRIVLDAAGGPHSGARVDIRLEPSDRGTKVTLIEDPAGFAAPLRYVPGVHAAIRLRNLESLRRLKRIAEARASASP
jgi:uncharacterized protein YndB with AHSA1/START domain